MLAGRAPSPGPDREREANGLAAPGTESLLAGRYRLRDQIATGGTGEVWRADDEVLGRAVAIKTLRPEYAFHAETLARFQAEARHAGRLAHPGVVQVYDYCQGQDAERPFLVMELIDGPSLATVLARGPQRPSWVLDIAGQVAAALAAAHAVGLVHRDIKPGNLLLAPGGVVKITDFGIASAIGSAPLTQSGMLACTPDYLAPERAAGNQAGPASDMYSLGVVAWEALTGKRPFTGTPLEVALAHTQHDLPPLPASVPSGLADLVAALTARDPRARPAAAAVAAQAGRLGAALPGTLPGALPGEYPAEAAPTRGAAPASRTQQASHPQQASDARPPATLRLPGPPTRGSQELPRLPLTRRPLGARPGRRAMLAVAGLAAVAALVAVLAIAAASTGGRLPVPSGHATQPTANAAGMVTIDTATLDGQPAQVVMAQLRAAGLRPRLVQQPDRGKQPGTVISVAPAGPVPAGTAVTVTVATAPPGHDHHGGGNGKHGGGNGNGGNGD
jgi:serine/threonine-protein kinase